MNVQGPIGNIAGTLRAIIGNIVALSHPNLVIVDWISPLSILRVHPFHPPFSRTLSVSFLFFGLYPVSFRKQLLNQTKHSWQIYGHLANGTRWDTLTTIILFHVISAHALQSTFSDLYYFDFIRKLIDIALSRRDMIHESSKFDF